MARLEDVELAERLFLKGYPCLSHFRLAIRSVSRIILSYKHGLYELRLRSCHVPMFLC